MPNARNSDPAPAARVANLKLGLLCHSADQQHLLRTQAGALGYPLIGFESEHAMDGSLDDCRWIFLTACSTPSESAALARSLRGRVHDCGVISTGLAADPRVEALLLDAGSDYHVPLPCDGSLLRACVNALMRRLLGTWSPDGAGVHLAPESCALRIGLEIFNLRRTEYRICEYLIVNRGRWVPEREVLRNVLDMRHDRETSLVRVHIRQIRKALGPMQSCILSRRGHGYQFAVPSALAANTDGREQSWPRCG
jgi:DNA-binding response OmpR family regulator